MNVDWSAFIRCIIALTGFVLLVWLESQSDDEVSPISSILGLLLIGTFLVSLWMI